MSDGIHPIATLLAALARGITGVQVLWAGCEPDERQRIYFANHTSHLDFIVLWSALPAEPRARTRPVAAKDYWEGGVKADLARNGLRAVRVQRGAAASEEEARAAGRATIEQLAEALGATNSLILFPEG